MHNIRYNRILCTTWGDSLVLRANAPRTLERLHRTIAGTKKVLVATPKMPSYAFLDVKISCEALTDDIVFASVAKGVPMRDNNVLSWFIKPAHESRYPQIVSGGQE